MFHFLSQFGQAFHSSVSNDPAFTEAFARFGRRFACEFQLIQDRFFVHGDAGFVAAPLACFRKGEFQPFERFVAFFRFNGSALEFVDIRVFPESAAGFFGPDFFRPSAAPLSV